MEDIDNLILEVKAGDNDAYKTLLEIHHRMIYKIIYSLNLECGDYAIAPDDLYQEGCLALYDAVFSYNKDKKVQFSTYAYMRIKNRIIAALRDYFRRKQDEYYSLDQMIPVTRTVCGADNPLIYHEEETFRESLDLFVNRLSYEDRQIIRMKAEDSSYRQIAEKLNISVKRVDNRLQLLRRKLKRYLETQQL